MPDYQVNLFLISLGRIIDIAVTLYIWIIIIRVLLSWISPNPYSPFMRFLTCLTDPPLRWARRVFPFTLGGLDCSPIILLFILTLAGSTLGQGLLELGRGAPWMTLIPIFCKQIIILINSIIILLLILMVIRLVMSLVNPAPYNPLVLIVYGLTEPLLLPLRRFFPPGPKGFDWRILVFLGLLILLQWVILSKLLFLTELWISRLVGASAALTL